MAKKSIIQHLLQDRTHIDYWSVIHFFSGVILAILFKYLGFRFIISFSIAFIILFLWEIIEPLLFKSFNWRFGEKISNQITDIIFGCLGFILYWFLF